MALGARIALPGSDDPFVAMFSESTGRALVSVSRANEARFTDLCADRRLPYRRIGVIDVLSGALDVAGPVPDPASRTALGLDVHPAGAVRALTRPAMSRVADHVAAFVEQTSALCIWLDALPAAAFAAPSVLDGWDVRTLVGHVVLVAARTC